MSFIVMLYKYILVSVRMFYNKKKKEEKPTTTTKKKDNNQTKQTPCFIGKMQQNFRKRSIAFI